MKDCPLVTVVIPTTNNPLVKRAISSVLSQSYENIELIICGDGVVPELYGEDDQRILPISLPFNTGGGGFNGHLIYAATSYLHRGDYICFLDEDNWYEVHHLSSLINAISVSKTRWGFSFRNVVTPSGDFICRDDCESLGNWPSYLDEEDFHVDVNCYIFEKLLAIQLSPVWYRKFLPASNGPTFSNEVDRIIRQLLRRDNVSGAPSHNYSLNYSIGSTERSVGAQFFLTGNKIQSQKYSKFPWNLEDKI